MVKIGYKTRVISVAAAVNAVVLLMNKEIDTISAIAGSVIFMACATCWALIPLEHDAPPPARIKNFQYLPEAAINLLPAKELALYFCGLYDHAARDDQAYGDNMAWVIYALADRGPAADAAISAITDPEKRRYIVDMVAMSRRG